MERLSAILQVAVKYLYTALLLLIVIMCLLCREGSYYTQKNMEYANWLYMVVGLGVIVLIRILLNCCKGSDFLRKHDRRIMLGLNLMLFLYLLVSGYHYYFRTGWDAGVVIAEASKIANADYGNMWNWYFDRCNNNIFITVIFVIVMKIGRFLKFGNDYFYLVMFLCAIWAYTGYMIYAIAVDLCKSRRNAVLAWVLYVLLIGLSPWVVVPYTDTVALFFLITLLYLFVSDRYPLLAGILLITGFYIKPQILIFGIAIVLIKILSNLKTPKNITTLKELLCLGLGIVLGILLVKGGIAASHIATNSQKNLGIPHYLMLGLNERTDGIFAEEDLIFSESFATKQERNTANLQQVRVRLQDMGVKGFVEHIRAKLLIVYNDGSFAWGTEGGFFEEYLFSGIMPVRDLFREFYYPEGKYYKYFLNGMQALWMGILGLCAFALCGKKRDEKLWTMALTIIGFTLFELLFEPRARHTLIFVPMYILLACGSIERLLRRIRVMKIGT